MNKWFWLCSLALVLGVGCAANAYGPVSSIDSAKVYQYVWQDDPDSTLTVVNNYPSYISFRDETLDGDGQGGEYANRHVWRFSADGGATPFEFGNTTYFEYFVDVKVQGDPVAGKHHEAGIFFDYLGWDGVLRVNTNGEIAAFGYVLPFYAFPDPYIPGDWIRIGVKYFQDPDDGKNKIQYYAGSAHSPALVFGNLEQGILDGTTIGGYGQFQIAPGVQSNFGMAEWGNVQIVPVPEPAFLQPASLMALAAGVGGLTLRRRR